MHTLIPHIGNMLGAMQIRNMMYQDQLLNYAAAAAAVASERFQLPVSLPLLLLLPLFLLLLPLISCLKLVVLILPLGRLSIKKTLRKPARARTHILG